MEFSYLSVIIVLPIVSDLSNQSSNLLYLPGYNLVELHHKSCNDGHTKTRENHVAVLARHEEFHLKSKQDVRNSNPDFQFLFWIGSHVLILLSSTFIQSFSFNLVSFS